MTKMHAGLRDRWCSALRSGRYEPGTACLRSAEPDGTSRFDPLGVLCDIVAVAGGGGEWRIDGDDAEVWSFRYESGAGYGDGVTSGGHWWRHFPPDTLLRAAGLDVPPALAVQTLAESGLTHAAIADWLENHL
jgi:hypothetical protein